jgi:hypothetical protein
VRDQTG